MSRRLLVALLASSLLAACSRGSSAPTPPGEGAQERVTGRATPEGSPPGAPVPPPAVPAPAPGAPVAGAPEEGAPQESVEPPAPPYSRILWVAPSGSDTAAGTEAAPLRTLARALSELKPGEAVYVQSGTYRERLVLGEQGGSAEKPLTLKAAPGAAPVLRGGTGDDTSMVDVQGAGWHLEGLTLDVAGDRAFAVIWRGAGAREGVLRGCTVKNGTAGAGLTVAHGASDVVIEGNSISNFQKSGGSGDSHGVVLQTTARNVVVRNNDIHHNSGDSVQCLGPEGGATVSGTPFDNLLVEGNQLHDNRENGVDIKTCTHVTLRANRVWGHQRSDTSAGEGIVVHMSARDVVVEDNVLEGNGSGITVGGVRQGAPPTRIILRRNRVLDGRPAPDEGAGIRVGTAVDVKVHHNTVWNMPGACFVFGSGDSGDTQALDARNNIFAGCATAVRAGPARASPLVDANLYFHTAGPAHFRLDGLDVPLTRWRTESGMDGRSLEQAPLFASVDTGDFHLVAGSPALEAGLVLGESFCGAAPDLGAHEGSCP